MARSQASSWRRSLEWATPTSRSLPLAWAEDMAKVISLDKPTCVPYRCFNSLLLTKEWTPLEAGVAEHKYYAKDVGFVRGVMVSGGREHTELVRITTGN